MGREETGYRVRAVRTAAVMTAAAMAAACTGAGAGAGAAKIPAVQSTPTGYYQQKLEWTDCKDGFQCADLKVPLDYAHPASGRLTLKVIRLPARNQAHRIGSLVTNPGGPGGSGVAFVRDSGRSFGAALRDSFDLVGFDPRGVGGSDPVRCLTNQQLDQYFATDSSPDTPAEVTALVATSKGFAAGCQARSARELPFVGTISAAHDMDILRSALGDKKMTYYGASYGTYLGAYYANEFPKNVRALVLDGAVDPKLSADELNIEQAKGFETALRAFAADCIKVAGCPLGTTSVDDAVSKVSALQARADAAPLTSTLGDGRVVGEALLTLGIATALYQKEAWPLLRLALTQANAGDGSMLLRLGDQLVERQPDGSYTNQSEANMAVNCVDKPYSTDLAHYKQAAAQAKRIAPRFGPFVAWGSLPCAYWPVRVTAPPRALAAAGSAPIVVVGTTRDPATPYQWAKNLAAELKSGVLLSLDGDGHTAYLQGQPCITKAVETYLLTEKPPAAGTLC